MRRTLLIALLAAASLEAQDPSSSAGNVSPLEEAALALISPEAIVRIEAINRLAVVSTEDSAAARELLEAALEDPDRNVAVQAAAALARGGRKRGENGTARIPRASASGAEVDADLETRRALRLAAHRSEQVRELDALAADSDPILRLRAVQGLGELAPAASETMQREVVTRLENATRDEDPVVAAQALATLTRLGGREPIPPELRRAHHLDRERAEVDEHEAGLADEDWLTRLRAVQALADRALTAVDPERVLTLLAAATADGDARVSAQAFASLERLEARAFRLEAGENDQPEED